ncbi:MAG TPA: hypothetical protein VK921_16350, partial [Anditalea sp.]|nr:hypothetical protein [Anditalea sp.]
MKVFTPFILVFVMGATIVMAQAPKKPKSTTMKPVMPYVADYSSSFSIADDSYSAKVLNLWKGYEENDLEKNKDYFSENVVAEIANGDVVSGRDNLLKSAKEYRSSLSNFSTRLLSWISLKSDDTDENWVAVWGEDSFTDGEGKSVKHALHEIYRFNKEG